VTRRHVFYLPGYDPFPSRRYREIYRREAALQGEISGYSVTVAGEPGGAAWTVVAQIDGSETTTRIEVLEWADLVRASMPGGVLSIYGALARTAWTYVRSGVLFRLFRLRKGPVLAALYPVVALVVQLGIALGAGGAVFRATTRLDGAGSVVGILLGFAVIWGLLRLFRRLDRVFLADYLMQDYAYAAQAGGAYPPELNARLDVFAGRIAGALETDVDEVLVVGHSSGAYLAVSVLARLDRAGLLDPKLAFLSLGHVVPMVSLLPRADALRGDLAMMGQQEKVFWLDVSAPGDGCAFALCHPVGVSGVAGPETRWPLVISARFSETLSPEMWARLRWRFFRLHFQYLHAFDRPGDYDYFQITAGPQSLSARFAGRAPSPSVRGAP
jgi:hypothetical protein